MSPFLKRMFGVVHVEQKGDTIQIGGMATQTLARDIMSGWGTSKIEKNMFSDIGRRYIEFAQFFAVEVHYILQTLLHGERNWTSKNALLAAVKAMEEHTWLARLNESHPTILDRGRLSLFHKKPLEHQDKFFRIYDRAKTALGLRGYLLSAAAGSGKTLTNLMLAEMCHADYVIIVSPNNAVYRVWDKTLKEEYHKPQIAWIAGEDKPYNKQRFLLTHYEGLDKLLAAASRVQGKVFIILDECHNFNEIGSLRTQRFIELCRKTKAENIVWSSGTPIKALGGESIPLLKTIDPLFTAPVEAAFKGIFGVNAKRALDILRNRMGMISYRVEKEGVIDNGKIPPKTIKVKIPNGHEYTLAAVKEKMSKFIEQRLEYYKTNYKSYETIYLNGLRAYEAKPSTSQERDDYRRYKVIVEKIKKYYDPKEMKEEAQFANTFELKTIMPKLDPADRKAFKGARSVIKYVHLKVMGEALGSVLGKARSQVHVDMLAHIKFDEIMAGAEKKTVIFTSYVAVVEALGKLLGTGNRKPMLVYGATNKNLVSNIDAFEKDPNTNPLIATFPSLSTAVPLIMADMMIFLNQPFRSHEKTQAEARIDRLGQDTDVKFINILLDTGEEPNISTRSQDILEWSKQQVAMILGQDYSGEVASTLDGYFASMEGYHSPAVYEFEESLNAILDEEMAQYEDAPEDWP